MGIEDADARRKAFAAWMAGMKGYGARTAAAHALARLGLNNEAAQGFFHDYIMGWAVESPEVVALWMNGYDELDRNLLINQRGVDIYKAWQDRAAADAWLDSLGQDTAEDIRTTAKDP